MAEAVNEDRATPGVGWATRQADVWRASSFLLGILFIVAAQYVLQQEPSFVRFFFTQPLNSLLRIDVRNPDNLFLSLAFLLAGGYCIAESGLVARFDDSLRMDREPSIRGLGACLTKRAGIWAIAAALFALLCLSLWHGDGNPQLAAIWILVLVIAGILFGEMDRRQGVKFTPSLSRADLSIVVVILIAGIVIGTFRLAEVPNSLIGDEGSFWIAAKAIATGEYKPSPFDLGVYSYPILGTFFQALFLRVGGYSLAAWRLASVVASNAAVVPLFLFARELWGRRTAVLASLLMIVLPYWIAYERLGYNNSQSIFPVALTVYLLAAGLTRGSILYLYLGGVAAGLGFYTYTAGQLGLVVGACFLGYLLAERLIRRKTALSRQASVGIVALSMLGVAFLVGWLLMVVPQFAYANAIRPELLATKTVEGVFASDAYAHELYPAEDLYRDSGPIRIGSYSFFFRGDLYLRLLLRGVIRTLVGFQTGDLINDHFIDGPLAGSITSVFYVIGLVILVANLKKRSGVLLGLWFLGGAFLLSAISTYPPRDAHLVPLIPALAILAALGIEAIADVVGTRLPNGHALAPSLAVACVALAAGVGLYEYFVQVQARYLPVTEHVIGFSALGLETPTNIVYVNDDPEANTRVPWVIQNIPNRAAYQVLSVADLSGGQLGLPPSRPTIIFFDERVQKPVTDYLSGILQRKITPHQFQIFERRPALYSYSFGP